MTNPLRILIVDDQRLMRDGLRTLLELEDDLDAVGEAHNGAAALAAYAQLQPDVVLMDIRMPEMDGVEATRRICQQWPQAHILILTTFDEDNYVFEGLRAGAMGYLLKDVSGAELAAAIRTVASGNALIGSSIARKVLTELSRLPTTTDDIPLTDPLSEREQEILQLIAQGYSNPQIAQQLHLAEGTVKNYVTNILQKTGSRDRTQAAVRARSLGLI
ncbi:MAG: response regulator transcription factor [Ardenticatenaceae bacterium]|nr:response regulator transcription factor [Ardenticatenaceae bacterium]